MSVFGLVDKQKVDIGFSVAENPATNFSDVFTAAVSATARNFNSNSKEFFEAKASLDRDSKYKDLTGRSLNEDVLNSFQGADYNEKFKQLGTTPEERQRQTDEYIAKIKAEDPERYKDVFTSAEITQDVMQKAKDALAHQAKVQAGARGASRIGAMIAAAGTGGLIGLASGGVRGAVVGAVGAGSAAAYAGPVPTGNLLGGLTASFIDPINLATLPLGVAPSAGILRTALIEAGINAAGEVIAHPKISAYQREMGNEYGFKDLLENAGIAAIFGAGMGTLAKGIPKLSEKFGTSRFLMMEEMRSVLRDLDDPKAAAAAGFEARRLHLEESNPARVNESVDPSLHNKALEEVDAALNNGRPIDSSKIPVTDEQIRGMDRSKMEPGAAQVLERMTEDSPSGTKAAESELAPKKVPDQAPNEIFEFNRTDSQIVERQKELAEMKESPEYKAREQAIFDQEKDGELRVFGDEEHLDLSVDEIRQAFKDDEDFINTISSCGLGGR